MKKIVFIGMVLCSGLPLQALAKAGNAKDGVQFILVLVGILLLLGGVLDGIDFLRKNGKGIVHRAILFFRKSIKSIKEFIQKITVKFTDLQVH